MPKLKCFCCWSSVKLEPQCSVNDKVNKSEVVIWLTTDCPAKYAWEAWVAAVQRTERHKLEYWELSPRETREEALKQRQNKVVYFSQFLKFWGRGHFCFLVYKNWFTGWDSESLPFFRLLYTTWLFHGHLWLWPKSLAVWVHNPETCLIVCFPLSYGFSMDTCDPRV